MKLAKSIIVLVAVAGTAVGQESNMRVSKNPTVWQPVTLSIPGPHASETGNPNPFRDFRLTFTFTHDSGKAFRVVPGFFAADGNSAETGATSGNRWKAIFRPGLAGHWHWQVDFRTGKNIATNPRANAGTAVPGDGLEGTIKVRPPVPNAPGFLATGPLVPGPGRYLVQEHLKGEPAHGSFKTELVPFLKAGADSPENLLAYADFDQTTPTHHFKPHIRDWNREGPTWNDGRGKGIIGALNYLAAQGVNSIYFLPMNVAGDGDDVWPWINRKTRDRFDVSKLAQWDIVFRHAASLGIALHFVLTETENESLFEELDGPGKADVPFAGTRKLYYRELIARFGYHPAIVWNIGEENGGGGRASAKPNTTAQRLAFAKYIKALDPYRHPVVVHTFPSEHEKIYEPLLGHDEIDGLSLQMGSRRKSHADTLEWIRRSRAAGNTWFVCIDEIGPANIGVVPDNAAGADKNHRLVRRVLWGNLLAGGSGVEWYFGYEYPHNDLNCEDFRSRQEVLRLTSEAVKFFQEYLPDLARMKPHDELVAAEGAWCLAQKGKRYAIYLPTATKPVTIKLPDGRYDILWFDPIRGDAPRPGTLASTEGGPHCLLGSPPEKPNQDWVVLVIRKE